MDIFIYLLKSTVSVVVSVLLLAMFVRAILSFLFDPMSESKISGFLFMLTEPVILPMRALCAKMHWFEGTPLDMPFVLTGLILSLLDLLVSLL